MKKRYSYLPIKILFIITILASCSKETGVLPNDSKNDSSSRIAALSAPNEVQAAIVEYGRMYDNILHTIVSDPVNSVTNKLDGPFSSYEQTTFYAVKAQLPEIQYMQATYFPTASFNYWPVLGEVEKSVRTPVGAINPSNLSYFTGAQKSILNSLSQTIQLDKGDIRNEIVSFRDRNIVSQPSLSTHEKIELLAITEGLYALSKYIAYYGTSVFYNEQLATNGRTVRCTPIVGQML
jgi:hypothetical protein